jgi:regulator of sigma E protease
VNIESVELELLLNRTLLFFQKKKYNIFSGIYRGFQETLSLASKILEYLGKLIIGRESVDQMGGPIKIVQISGQVAEYGLIPLLGLIAAISVNLGVINLLPIPVLDGGHLMFYSYEVIFGKPVNQKVQEYGIQIGVSLLIALMVFVTILDISRF